MPQKAYWYPKMMWYGPSGIGTVRGLQGFVDYHQLPFRTAFERPVGTLEEVHAIRKTHGAGHYIRIGDGAYSVAGGWPSVYAIHNGGDFLGTGPTNRPVTMRVMDFYLHDEGLICENWVPLDILDLLRQIRRRRLRARGIVLRSKSIQILRRWNWLFRLDISFDQPAQTTTLRDTELGQSRG